MQNQLNYDYFCKTLITKMINVNGIACTLAYAYLHRVEFSTAAIFCRRMLAALCCSSSGSSKKVSNNVCVYYCDIYISGRHELFVFLGFNWGQCYVHSPCSTNFPLSSIFHRGLSIALCIPAKINQTNKNIRGHQGTYNKLMNAYIHIYISNNE
jgi:hypothetical protein